MKIVLISPKTGFTTNIKTLQKLWNNSEYLETYRNIWSRNPGIGLLTIAALTPPGYDIYFIDENIEEINFSQNYDLVGISAMTPQAVRAYSIGDRFRQKSTKVIIGGIHATLLPHEAKKHADSVLLGEAEYLWSDVIKDLGNGNLKPFYKSEKSIKLEESPIPRFDLLTPNKYSAISIQTSRGCPHDCEYCTSSRIFGSTYRCKNIEQIVNEVDAVKCTCKNSHIVFVDDNFLVNKKWARILLEQLTYCNIRWDAQCDISIGADHAMLELMKKSGCASVFIGLESISPNGLKGIDKNDWKFHQLNNYSTYIQQIQHHNIGVIGAFMVGLDSDKKNVFEYIAHFVIENNLLAASITIVTPVPGTRLRERWEREARLLSTNWDNYTGYNVNHIPKNMSVEDLEEGIVDVYENIYCEEVNLKKMKYFIEIALERRKKRKKEFIPTHN